MSRSKLWIPALAVCWLAGAAVRAEDAVPTPAAGAEAQAAAAPAETSSPDALVKVEPVAVAPAAEVKPAASADQAAAAPMPDSSAAAAPGAAVPDQTPVPAAATEATGPAPDAQAAAGSDASAPATEAGTEPPLGAIGYDSQGHAGRVHIVRRGDTLWDISDAYLGTPWVWPSIWRDNSEIANPHLIYPGDHIWITPTEMRKVSPEEAAKLLANKPAPREFEPAAAEEPGAPVVTPAPEPERVEVPTERPKLKVSARETAGLITPEEYEAAGSIVGRVPERILMSQEDLCYVGLGEGRVAKGDQLSIIRTKEKVFDPDTGRLLGYHVDFLGWAEVTETHPEASVAKIRMSTGEVQQGDRVIPRQQLPAEIAIQQAPSDVEGKITFFPQKRVVIGWNDFVYLNRGTSDGIEVGTPLEVFRPGRLADEPARDEKVQVPDLVIAKLLVVRTSEESSVALVTKATTELELGDRFRGTSQLGEPATVSQAPEAVIPVHQPDLPASQAPKGKTGSHSKARRR
jgi:hypothetical protein